MIVFNVTSGNGKLELIYDSQGIIKDNLRKENIYTCYYFNK